MHALPSKRRVQLAMLHINVAFTAWPEFEKY